MKIRLFAAISAVLALCTALPARSTTIEVIPSSQSVIVGSTTTADLFVSGLGDGTAPSLGTFDLDISYDSSILNFNNATFGTQLDIFGLGNVQFVTSGVGTINLFELSFDFANDLDILQASSFLMATLSFDALVSGSSILSVTLNALGDSAGNQLQAGLVAGNIDVQSVGVVPEPSSLPLIWIGMLGVIAATRLSRKPPLQFHRKRLPNFVSSRMALAAS